MTRCWSRLFGRRGEVGSYDLYLRDLIATAASLECALVKPMQMIEILSGSIYNEISDKITQKIALDKLPLYGEKEVIKLSAELYGMVKIKLGIEEDADIINQIHRYINAENAAGVSYFTYKWEANPSMLPKEYERYIKPEIESFTKLLSIFDKRDKQILRFSVVGGAYRANERPGHKIATQLAIIELFKQV